MEPETIRALLLALRDEKVDYVLVGALALDVHGIGRLTEDVDLFVRPTSDTRKRAQRQRIYSHARMPRMPCRPRVVSSRCVCAPD